MRPIVWGLIICVLGAFFWIIFSVVFGIAFIFENEMPPFNRALILLTGLAMLFGIPAGLVGEAVRWKRRKKTSEVPSAQLPKQATVGSLKYCTQCGREVQANLAYCGFCGERL